MTTAYPAGLDSFTRPTTGDPMDSGATKASTVIDNAYDAIEAIQAELGTDPAGSAATVKARLDANSSVLSGTGAPSGGQDGDFYIRVSANTLASNAMFGPKASGSWPTLPIAIFPRGITGYDLTLGVAADGVAQALTPSVYVAAYGTSASPPGATTSNLDSASNQLKRGASTAIGYAVWPAITVSFDPPAFALGVVSLQINALPTATFYCGGGFSNGAANYGYLVASTSDGKLTILKLNGGTPTVVAQGAAGTVVAGDYLYLQRTGQVMTAQSYDGTAKTLRASTSAYGAGGFDPYYGVNPVVWFGSGDTAGRISIFAGVV